MTRYNMSEIMTNAHIIRKNLNTTMSDALRKAWQKARLPKVIDQKAELIAAFTAKYPSGKIRILQYWMGATVQYSDGGKVYTYRGHGWQSRLGVA